MARPPWPSGLWGSLRSSKRSSRKPKAGQVMPNATHGRHGTMHGRRWTPRRQYGGLMRRGGGGGAGPRLTAAWTRTWWAALSVGILLAAGVAYWSLSEKEQTVAPQTATSPMINVPA